MCADMWILFFKKNIYSSSVTKYVHTHAWPDFNDTPIYLIYD